MEHLQNLKIVITAAASGLGSVIATTLSKSGSQVYICDNNKGNEMKKNVKGFRVAVPNFMCTRHMIRYSNTQGEKKKSVEELFFKFSPPGGSRQ